MSECVVRMEKVPKNCDDGCWGSLSGECPWCDSIDGYKMVGNRPPNCPIIAVLPEGHGRLVDINDVEGMFEAAQIISDDDCNCGYVTDDLRLEELPTIVPADTAGRSE